MPEKVYIHDGTAWRDCSKVYIHDGTTWRDCSKAYVHDGTAWRNVFAAAGAPVVNLDGEMIQDFGPSRFMQSTLRVKSDGYMYKYTIQFGENAIDTGTDWIIPHASGTTAYEVRVLSGYVGTLEIKPGADDTWFDLTSTREWGITENAGNNKSLGPVTLEIREGSSGPALASAQYNFQCWDTDL